MSELSLSVSCLTPAPVHVRVVGFMVTMKLLCGCRSLSNPQIPRMVRTISNLHGGSLPRDVRLSDLDTTGECVYAVVNCSLFARRMSTVSVHCHSVCGLVPMVVLCVLRERFSLAVSH